MPLRLHKMHANGDDFVVVDSRLSREHSQVAGNEHGVGQLKD
jgi:hypothetical protein